MRCVGVLVGVLLVLALLTMSRSSPIEILSTSDSESEDKWPRNTSPEPVLLNLSEDSLGTSPVKVVKSPYYRWVSFWCVNYTANLGGKTLIFIRYRYCETLCWCWVWEYCHLGCLCLINLVCAYALNAFCTCLLFYCKEIASPGNQRCTLAFRLHGTLSSIFVILKFKRAHLKFSVYGRKQTDRQTYTRTCARQSR